MNPSPIGHHQMIVANISGFLWRFKAERGASWFPIPGTGTRVPVSEESLPQPDIMVLERPPTASPVSDEALVLFEVLSPSNTRADRDWRRKVYASVPNCQPAGERRRGRAVRLGDPECGAPPSPSCRTEFLRRESGPKQIH
jgi:hypothetical protein